jgi:hypothetical protein
MSYYANKDTHFDMDDLEKYTPAAFATKPHEKCSPRYGYIDTRRMIDYFLEEGYTVASAHGGQRGSSRKFGMHTVRMRAPSTSVIVGDLYPEIVLTNSHDKSSRAILDLGIHRGACSNGLVVGTAAGLRFSIPHLGDQREAVITAAKRALEYVPQLKSVVESWSDRSMTADEIREFTQRAAIIKTTKGDVDLALVRREADRANNLWNVFNRTQESIIRGGSRYRNEITGRRATTRPVGSVRKALDINQKLWELAEEFLPA